MCIYIGLVGDMCPVGANGNMGALRPLGMIDPNRTKINNRINSRIRLGQKAQNHSKYNGLESSRLILFMNAIVWEVEAHKSHNHYKIQWFGKPKAQKPYKYNSLDVRRLIVIIRYNGLGSPRLKNTINTIVCMSKGSEPL